MTLEGHFNYKRLFLFTLPTMIQLIVISLYTVIDGLFVSNVCGNSAFSSLNFAYPIIGLLGVIGFMFGSGGGALVAKYFGEGNFKKGNQVFSFLFYIMIIIGIIFAVIGYFTMNQFLKLLGATDTIIDNATTYGKIMILGLPFLMSMYFYQTFMIVAGKPTLSFIFSICSGLVNVLLDFLLIYVFKFGISGAAIATVASESLGLFLPTIYLLSKFNKTNLHFTSFIFDKADFIKALTNGLSEMITNLAVSIIAIVFNAQLLKYFGDFGVAAYGTIQYVGFVFTGVYYGYACSVSQLISYNYGADNKKELKSLFNKSIIMYIILQLILATTTILLSKVLAKAFSNNDLELENLTAKALMLYATSYYLSGFNQFSSALFTSYNNGLISGLLALLRTFVFQLLCIFITPLILGSDYIWLSVLFSETLSIIVAIIFVIKYGKKYAYLLTYKEIEELELKKASL